MATIMTKQGRLDNIVTYEHICDTVADMANINPNYVTLGSVCIVISGESDGLEVYIANSRKQWEIVSFSAGGVDRAAIHICAQDEYDSVTGIPTIEAPLSNTFYLTPGSGETNDLYNEWIWLEEEEEWEKFGSATTAISQPDWNQNTSSANDFIKNKPSIRQQANGGILINAAASASGENSLAEGNGTTASGIGSHAEGVSNTASGIFSHAEGAGSKAAGAYSHAEGSTEANGAQSHTEGVGTKTTQAAGGAHAEGNNTVVEGSCAHAEGDRSKATGAMSHAEGSNTTASGQYSHTEGVSTGATKIAAHAEGINTQATADGAHAEGYNTSAQANYSHSEGSATTATGLYAHAEGLGSEANAIAAHAEGWFTVANSSYQRVFGKANISDTPDNNGNGTYVEIVGNGTGSESSFRSNARTLDWSGNEEVAGDVVAYGCGGANPISLASLKNQIDASPVESGSAAGSVQTKSFTYSDATITQIASGVGSFAEGYETVANGMGAHAEGVSSKSLASCAHAEGSATKATNIGAHAEGSSVIATGQLAHIEGGTTNVNCSITGAANATTYTVDNATMANILLNSPIFVHSLNKVATVTAIDIVNKTITVSATFGEELTGAPAIIYRAYASGNASHVEGIRCIATEQGSHSEGYLNFSNGLYSHTEGNITIASGLASHAEGGYTIARGHRTHAENYKTLAYGENTHAENLGENYNLKVTGDAEATTYTYSGTGDPSVGDVVNRNQYCSRITAVDSVNKTFTVDTTLHYQLSAQSLSFYCSGAFGANSHVEGKGTTAIGDEQHVQGRYNTVDNNNTYAEIVGNGTAHNVRSNARALDWEGNEYLASDVYVGCGTDSTGGTKLARVGDIQVNGTSIISNGVANVPVGTTSDFGVVRLQQYGGLQLGSTGLLKIDPAQTSTIKTGTDSAKPLVSARAGDTTFYGLAKAAGDSTQSASSNAVGTYTDEAKAAIKNMLGVSSGMNIVTVSGTAPTITAQTNTQYICGEVVSLDFTPAATGISDVIFTSGSTMTVLTLPATVKMPDWFEVEANKIYEICVTNGVYGAVMVWENA